MEIEHKWINISHWSGLYLASIDGYVTNIHFVSGYPANIRWANGTEESVKISARYGVQWRDHHFKNSIPPDEEWGFFERIKGSSIFIDIHTVPTKSNSFHFYNSWYKFYNYEYIKELFVSTGIKESIIRNHSGSKPELIENQVYNALQDLRGGGLNLEHYRVY